jgi:hypothetical protein
MKVKDVIKEIEQCKKEYGEDFLEWEVYTEQIDAYDKKQKKAGTWEIIRDSDGWEYFRCVGFSTKFPKQRIFTINVNY